MYVVLSIIILILNVFIKTSLILFIYFLTVQIKANEWTLSVVAH